MDKSNSLGFVKRRTLVRTLRLRGLTDDEILDVLVKQNHLEGYSKERPARLKVLREDKIAILEEDRQRFSIDGEDSKVAREDSINRILELFRAAFVDKQFATARGLAKDLEQQSGVITEETLQVNHKGTSKDIHRIVDRIREDHGNNQ